MSFSVPPQCAPPLPGSSHGSLEADLTGHGQPVKGLAQSHILTQRPWSRFISGWTTDDYSRKDQLGVHLLKSSGDSGVSSHPRVLGTFLVAVRGPRRPVLSCCAWPATQKI